MKDWPEDKAKAEGSMAMLTDFTNAKKYTQAIPHLNWLLGHAPNLHTSIYIHGVNIYEALAKSDSDPARKRVHVDSLLRLYDMRIQHCGDLANVLNRKAISAYYFDFNTAGKEKELLALFDKVFELKGNDVMDATLVPYMQVVQVNQLKLSSLSNEEVLDRYDKIMAAIDAKIKKNPANKERYNGYRKQVEDILISPGVLKNMSCDFIINKMGGKYRENPADKSLRNRIFMLMTQAHCIDDPLWIETGEEYVLENPDFKITMVIGKQYWVKGNIEKAEGLFKKALSYASTPQENAEALIALGKVEERGDNKPAARQHYRDALSKDPGNKIAFEAIGDLYYNSYIECAEKKSQATDRLVFIAAYEMYAKAGNKEKMANAKSAFPSSSEMHDLDWKEGDVQAVGCWINEKVVLQKRVE
jgi:tetratricopeptide (TPR) repeat protein